MLLPNQAHRFALLRSVVELGHSESKLDHASIDLAESHCVPAQSVRRCFHHIKSKRRKRTPQFTGKLICYCGFILLLASLFLVSACATRVNHAITDEQRDRSGRYDGKWMVTRLDAPRVQQLGRERFRCPTEGFSFSVYVHDGVMQVSRYGSLYEAYVASNGQFRLTIPTQGKYRRSMGVDDNKSDITIVLQGSLADGERSGWYTLGSARLNNYGCQAKATFEPVQRTSHIHTPVANSAQPSV